MISINSSIKMPRYPSTFTDLFLPIGTRCRYIKDCLRTIPVADFLHYLHEIRNNLLTTNNPYFKYDIQFKKEPNHVRKVLILDHLIPDPTLGAGFPRAYEIICHIVKLFDVITIFPIFDSSCSQQTLARYKNLHAELFWAKSKTLKPIFINLLLRRKNYYDLVFISRPDVLKASFKLVKKYQKRAKIVYDAEAIFSDREINYYTVSGRKISGKEKKKIVSSEMSFVQKADAVTTICANDKKQFETYGIKNVHIVGHVMRTNPTSAGFTERKGILFVGSTQKPPNPNEDSLVYFCSEIFPKVNKQTDARLLIIGNNRSGRVSSFASESICILGPVEHENLFTFYNSHRIFVAPTRFAAGIPLKVLEAAAFGVPVVATPLLAEQLGWEHEKHLLVGKDAGDFATQCIRLYQDEDLWNRITTNALGQVRQECNEEKFQQDIFSALDPLIKKPIS